MKESGKSKVKPKLWMVKEVEASERFDETSIEGKDSISREELRD